MERKRKQRDASRLKSYEECMFHTIDLKISKEYKKQKRKKAEPNETIKELEKLVKYIPIAAKAIFNLTHHRRWLAILQFKRERAKDETH
jgi:hypothetical protein